MTRVAEKRNVSALLAVTIAFLPLPAMANDCHPPRGAGTVTMLKALPKPIVEKLPEMADTGQESYGSDKFSGALFRGSRWVVAYANTREIVPRYPILVFELSRHTATIIMQEKSFPGATCADMVTWLSRSPATGVLHPPPEPPALR